MRARSSTVQALVHKAMQETNDARQSLEQVADIIDEHSPGLLAELPNQIDGLTDKADFHS